MTRVLACLVGLLALNAGSVACAGQGQDTPEALRARVERLLHRGDAVAALQLLADRGDAPATDVLRGDAFAVAADFGRAAGAFERAASTESRHRWYARARLAELAERRGARDEALRLAAEIDREIDLDGELAPADWVAFGIVSRLLGSVQPARWKDALEALDRAIARDSAWIEPQLRVAELFLEKYNAPDAREGFEAVLQRDPDNARAHLGLAAAALFAGDPGTGVAARRALASGPELAAAQVLAGRLDLDAERYDSARTRGDRAVALDSTVLEGWALRGAVELLTGDRDAFDATARRLSAWHQAPARFYAQVAEALGRHRRYEEAATLAREAVRIDPNDPVALTVLGVNELRTGAIDSGRARLERAFERDPYHVWNKNTLDLLDELAGYRTVRSPRFEFVAAPEEVELLTLYLAPLMERAYDSLAARYRYRPPTPVRIELFRRHADFSVRTVGLAGLGALGVSFGRVLVMDAPSARPRGEVNWGSVAWHELAHTFTLGASDHKVPRWLSEGLSVLEERRARPGWGAQATLVFLSAYKGKLLEPVSTLNDGFVRPDFPGQVSLSYYQASLVCEYLESVHGFEVILRMLEAYRRGETTAEAIRSAVAMEPDQLDRAFDEWLGARFRDALAKVGAARDSVIDPGELGALIENAKRLVAAGRADEAVPMLQRVQAAFPDQGDRESAAWLLARIHRERGEARQALEQVAKAARYSDTHLEANREEAELREETGDPAGAARALERAIYIDPYDPGSHARLAALASAARDHRTAIRERQAVLALAPADPAEARYQLAAAYRDAGDVAAARREVLRVLERAPSFEKAQMLLLELRREP